MLTPLVISFIALTCILAGALLGGFIRVIAPDHYLDSETRDVVKLSVGLIATLTALVVGLLIATAKSSYDAKDSQIKQLTANIIELDNVLATYGPDATMVRTALRRAVPPIVDQIWIENRSAQGATTAFRLLPEGQAVARGIFQLSPQNETQRTLRDLAVKLITDISQTRLLLFTTVGNAIPTPFLIILISWVAILFVSFGLLTRANPVAINSIVVCAISTSTAIYLILELGTPFSGFMAISSEPLRNALIPLAQ